MTLSAPSPNASVATSSFNPLRNERQMAELISGETGQSIEQTIARLRAEFDRPGSTVGDDIARRGLTPYVWNDALIEFYGGSDAFLFELAIWNCNRLKSGMRKWIVDYLKRRNRSEQQVLSIGDGLGFDSLELSRAGHHLTYFEFPGRSERIARKLFAESGADVEVVTDSKLLPLERFDVVMSLDVLEHVPRPGDQVREMVGWLKPGGLLITSAPFHLIHPAYATHLAANRKYAGSLKLFTSRGVELVGGRAMWNPLVFRKTGGTSDERLSAIEAIRIRLGGLYLKSGRKTALPQIGVTSLRKRNDRWFC